MTRSLRLPILLALCSLPFSASAQKTPFAFVDVNVVPMDREVVLAHYTVLVKDGRIVAVGPNSSIKIPHNTQRIDGRNRYLMPGLADMHVHFMRPVSDTEANKTAQNRTIGSESPTFAEENLTLALLYVANGVTIVHNLWGHPEITELGKEIAAGKVLGPHIYSSGPITDGAPVMWHGSRSVTNAEQARAAVREDKQAGYDAIKVYDSLSKEAYEAIAAEAKKEDLPVVGHVPDAVGMSGVLAAHQYSVEHIEYPLIAILSDSAKQPPSDADLVKYSDLTKLPDLARQMKTAGTWLDPTLVAYGRPRTDAVWLEQQELVPPAILARYKKAYASNTSEPVIDPLDGPEAHSLYLTIVGALHKGGVNLLLGTDAHKPSALPGFSIHEELASFVAAGLTPFEAIRAGTSDAARFLHQEAEFGTVAVGRRADLILLTANPLEDVANVQKRGGVMVQGNWLSEDVLKAKLKKLSRINGQAKQH
jgi:imidazolonepropionase-like amidohydrolase